MFFFVVINVISTVSEDMVIIIIFIFILVNTILKYIFNKWIFNYWPKRDSYMNIILGIQVYNVANTF